MTTYTKQTLGSSSWVGLILALLFFMASPKPQQQPQASAAVVVNEFDVSNGTAFEFSCPQGPYPAQCDFIGTMFQLNRTARGCVPPSLPHGGCIFDDADDYIRMSGCKAKMNCTIGCDENCVCVTGTYHSSDTVTTDTFAPDGGACAQTGTRRPRPTPAPTFAQDLRQLYDVSGYPSFRLECTEAYARCILMEHDHLEYELYTGSSNNLMNDIWTCTTVDSSIYTANCKADANRCLISCDPTIRCATPKNASDECRLGTYAPAQVPSVLPSTAPSSSTGKVTMKTLWFTLLLVLAG